jgi:hypothetical protein
MVGLIESQWATVRDTLPNGIDETWFRGELERIANDTLSPKKQEQMYLDSARLCAAMIRRLPAMEHITDRVALSEQLKHQQQEDRNHLRPHRGSKTATALPAAVQHSAAVAARRWRSRYHDANKETRRLPHPAA